MKVVFFGSGPFALPALERLEACARGRRHQLLRVVTRPERPGGRGRKLTPTPVRLRAAALGLSCDAPASANEPAYLEQLAALKAEIFVVADYGEILGQRLRAAPSIGVFNLHASLLPRWRGAAPVAHALLAGDAETGVTLFKIEAGLDTGPLVDAARTPIEPLESAAQLEERLSRLAADLLERNLEPLAAGAFRLEPQDEKRATLAPKLAKQAGLIDWDRPPEDLVNFVRALNPWPGAFSFLKREGKPLERILFLRVLAAGGAPAPRPAPAGDPLPPGAIDHVEQGGFTVRCRGGRIEVLELQRQGKAPLPAAAFLRGLPLEPGDRFVAGA